ncbi:hypothetical protein ACIHEJ_35385 [Streptomyces sp. NPDC052301]|uniref:hypothetical protein n=1 Tax=Streptomyces sp. NPDC052301 TaxID=3365687 RepID=UPI0037D62FA6
MAIDDLSGLTDQELMSAGERVLEEFATTLEILRIACGAPAQLTLHKKSKKDGRCTLPTSTLSEVFNGKRLPNYDFTMELIRQLRPGDATLQEEWHQRWMKAKYTVTWAAKAQKRLEAEAGEGQHREDGEAERLREEAAAELQRASDLRMEAEKTLGEARAEAARILEQARRDTAASRRDQVSLSGPNLLRDFLIRQFLLLTEPGSSAVSALLQPRMAHAGQSPLVPTLELGDLWRILHLLTLRLPQEDAVELRARWRAMALGIVGEPDGDGPVPGLPGVVQPLSFRDRATTMSSLAQRDHCRALLANFEPLDIEIPGKLQYVLALIREYHEENQLLMRYEPYLMEVPARLKPGWGPMLQAGDGGAQIVAYEAAVGYLLSRLPDSGGVAPAIVGADELLAALVPDPMPHRDSWWFHRRRGLRQKLASYLASLQLEVQVHDQLSTYVTNELTQNNIELVDQAGNTVLWWLRMPYRAKGTTEWNKGRMIHQRYIA